MQVSQGSGAPPQDETSNEGLVVDVDSPATSQSKYSPVVSSCILCVSVCVCMCARVCGHVGACACALCACVHVCACVCVCVCLCMWSFIRFGINFLKAIIVRFNQCVKAVLCGCANIKSGCTDL